MAQAYFPFTSLNDDRLYGSADFRMFFRTLLGNGRVTYDEIGITDPREGLLCTRDSVDSARINVSPGACFINGAEYYTDETVSLTIELPTGSTIYRGYIIARIDVDSERNISLLTVQSSGDRNEFIKDTDLVLGRYATNSSGVTGINNYGPDTGEDEIIVAYTKYNLNKEQQDYIIEQLGRNQDLINYLSTNTTLLNLLGNSSALATILSNNADLVNRLAANTSLHNALANNSDFIALIKGITKEYTYIVNDTTTFSRWASNASGYDYSRVLIKENVVWNGAGYSTSVVVDLTSTNTVLVDMEKGKLLTINTQNGTSPLMTDGYIFNISTGDTIKRMVKNLNIRVMGQGRIFGVNAYVDGCTITMWSNVSPTILLQAFFYSKMVTNCNVSIENAGGGIRIGGSAKHLSNITVDGSDGSENVSRNGATLFDNCTNLSNITINYICGGTTSTILFNSCYNISNVIAAASNASLSAIINGFVNTTNISNIHLTLELPHGSSRGFVSCNRVSNARVETSANNVILLNSCNSVSDVTGILTNVSSAAEARPYVLASHRISNVDITAYNNDPTAGNVQTGFANCSVISNSRVAFVGTGSHRCGFFTCSSLSNCAVLSNTAAALCYGFQSCQRLTGCDVSITNSVGSRGITGSYYISSCVVTISNTGSGGTYGIINSYHISSSACVIIFNGLAVGMESCYYINTSSVTMLRSNNTIDICCCYRTSQSISDSLANFGYASGVSQPDTSFFGFINCDGVSSCRWGKPSSAANATGVQKVIGFNGCYGVTRSGGLANTTTNYIYAFDICWASAVGVGSTDGRLTVDTSDGTINNIAAKGFNVGRVRV